MMGLNRANQSAGPLSWQDLWKQSRFAIARTWKASPLLMGGLAFVEALASLVPVLFALAAGLVIRELRAVFEGTPGHETMLGVVLGGLVGLMLAETLAKTARLYISSRLTDILRHSLSLEIAEHLSKIDLAFFEDREGQDIIERAGLQPGTDMVQFVLTITRVLTQGFQAISLAAVLIYIEPVYTPLVVLVSIPLLVFRWHMAKLSYRTRRHQATIRRWTGYYMSTLTNRAFIPTVKTYKLAPVLIRQLAAYLGKIIGVNQKLYRKQAIGSAIASTAVTIAALGLVVWVGYRAINGEVSIELLGTFVVGINRIQASIQTFVDAVASGLEKVLYISNLSELFEQKAKIRAGSETPATVVGKIEIQDLRFGYPGSKVEVLKGVNMTLEAGKTIALLGPNGCGKTTLARLITRLYDIHEGRVLIDGTDIRDLSLSYLRDNIAFVNQSPVCFEATARDNIAYGNWDRLANDPEGVRRIAEDANIADMIERFPDGFDTLIGRRFGTFDLSVGQWQKLAIAQALARNAPILILDEPTASMDAHAEEEMYSSFQKLARGKTTFLISHRFSTVAMADYIYIMDDGRIVDGGSHDELLEREGIYSAMYQLHHRVSKRQLHSPGT